MKVVLINKSDQTGGAAVVTRRLMEALRDEGVDARMLVVEKLTDSPYVTVAAPKRRTMVPFLVERLKIFLSNGFNRQTLFKADIASDGLPLWRHRWVREADVVCLNWVNQGMLSLKGIRRIATMGKPIVWTMHDMWNATGVCHHAGECDDFDKRCQQCPLIGKNQAAKTWQQKFRLYGDVGINFVAVSNWLARRCRQSELMKDVNLHVIPNAFPIDENFVERPSREPDEPLKIVMGAARLDDPIKGFPILIETLRLLAETEVSFAKRLELVTFGSIRDSELFRQIAIPHTHLGVINDPEQIKEVYRQGDIVISTSLYETLPGTLIEGQAYGCLPVAFDRGGQSDIITHKRDGYLAKFDDDINVASRRILKGITWAINKIDSAKYGEVQAKANECGLTAPYNISQITYRSVVQKFSSKAVAKKYIGLFNEILTDKRSRK